MPRLLLFYHFFHPDDVASARHFGDLAEEQQRRGWQVTVLTSNRSRQRGQTFAAYESWNGIEIHRVSRPDWDQSKPLAAPAEQRLDDCGVVHAHPWASIASTRSSSVRTPHFRR